MPVTLPGVRYAGKIDSGPIASAAVAVYGAGRTADVHGARIRFGRCASRESAAPKRACPLACKMRGARTVAPDR